MKTLPHSPTSASVFISQVEDLFPKSTRSGGETRNENKTTYNKEKEKQRGKSEQKESDRSQSKKIAKKKQILVRYFSGKEVMRWM
jgi:hypothetical protein